MVIFIDWKNDTPCSFRLNVTGEKKGSIFAETIEDACYKLLRYLTKNDVAYININGYGVAIADILQKYLNVRKIKLTANDIIGD